MQIRNVFKALSLTILVLSIPLYSHAATLDIKDFGARCDGSDDADAIQSAVNSLKSGDTLTVPCKASIGRAGIIVEGKSGVTIEGRNGGGFISLEKTKINNTCLTGTIFLYVSNSSDSNIKNLYIDVNRQGNIGISEYNSSNITFSGNTVKNAGGSTLATYSNAFISAAAGRNNTWTNNTIYGGGAWLENDGSMNGTRGFWIGNGSSGSSCGEDKPVISYNNVSYTGHTAIASNNTNGAIFSNNTVNNACTPVVNPSFELGCAGIKTVPNSTGSNTISYIENNTISNSRNGQGIQLESANTPGIIVRNNTITRVDGSGVYTGGNPTRNVQILNNTITGAKQSAVSLINTQSIKISGNKFVDDSSFRLGNGIDFQAISPSISINNIEISNNAFLGSQYSGITMYNNQGVSSQISDVRINNNSFTRNNLAINIEEKGVSGIFKNITTGDNCYSQNSINISDNRSTKLPTPSSSTSCADNTSGSTQTQTTLTPVVTTTSPAPSSITTVNSTLGLIRINAGGEMFVDSAGIWAKDPSSGNFDTVTNTISNTSSQTLYQSLRWGDKSFGYKFTLPNGNYQVTLKFAETYVGGTGERVFSVYANDRPVIADLDVYKEAGGKYKAIDKTFPVSVSNGSLSLNFTSSVEDPFVSALEIAPVVATPTTPTTPTQPTTPTAPTNTTTTISGTSGVIRFNAGGPSYTDSNRNAWTADSGDEGHSFKSTNTISGATDQTLYKDHRWGEGKLSYKFTLPNGNYQVTLKFADTYMDVAGKRVFNIDLNGQRVLRSFDIIKEAGSNNRAVDKVFTTTVTNGSLPLDLVGVVENPMVSAIQIVPVIATPTMPTTPTQPTTPTTPAPTQTTVSVPPAPQTISTDTDAKNLSAPVLPWAAKFYSSTDSDKFKTLVFTRTDSSINFDWVRNAPDPRISADNFAARWDSYIVTLKPAVYNFSVTTDDGMAVWIDGQKIFDSWKDQPTKSYTFAKYLNTGLHPIRVDYYDKTGEAVAKLSWTISPTVANSFWQSLQNMTASIISAFVR